MTPSRLTSIASITYILLSIVASDDSKSLALILAHTLPHHILPQSNANASELNYSNDINIPNEIYNLNCGIVHQSYLLQSHVYISPQPYTNERRSKWLQMILKQ
eukprot:TRINITY_DN8027_c0_g1_i1.p1 TRINITY_DN8027_c0_g1~~TRINITY_DN8027_c0_g1_i1.p1  ORF type:complete len:104 (-),score=2.08 TRINITY_DN8027_c0_g1_i1:196-507(-)